MLYTILEVSKITGLSKVTVYKKLKLKVMIEHTSKRQGKTCIDEEGLKLIRDSLQDLNFKEPTNTTKDGNEDSQGFYMDNKVFKLLNDQLKMKDDQIKELNERLKTEQQQNQNNQVLLKDKPKLLEEKKEGWFKKFFM